MVRCACSHQDVDVTDPDFFRNAKQKGYTPPNKEVLSSHWAYLCSANIYSGTPRTLDALTVELAKAAKIIFTRPIVVSWSLLVMAYPIPPAFFLPFLFGWGVGEEDADRSIRFLLTYRSQDVGQPGFTQAERQRFSKVLAECVIQLSDSRAITFIQYPVMPTVLQVSQAKSVCLTLP